MKPASMYQNLIDLAEKLGIEVSEQNLRITGLPVKSGLCKVKDQWLYVMDKHKSLRERIDLLATCLGMMPHEQIYVVPAIREILTAKTDVKNAVPVPDELSRSQTTSSQDFGPEGEDTAN